MNLFCVVHAKNKLEVSLVISPFYFLFAIYIFANAFAAAHAVLTGGMVVEGQRFLFSADIVILAFVVQVFLAASLFGLSKVFYRRSSRSDLVLEGELASLFWFCKSCSSFTTGYMALMWQDRRWNTKEASL